MSSFPTVEINLLGIIGMKPDSYISFLSC